MKELWKDLIYINGKGEIIDYQGIYQISNLGRVRSFREHGGSQKQGVIGSEPHLVKLSISETGYYRFGTIKPDGRKFSCLLHRALCSVFIPIPDRLKNEKKLQVNHIDEDKSNNSLENLEWCTPKENTNHGTRTRRAVENGRKIMDTLEWKEKHSLRGANVNARAIIGINVKTNEIVEFESMSCVNEFFNKKYADRCVSDTIRGEQKTAYGYKWYYKEDYEKLSEKHR